MIQRHNLLESAILGLDRHPLPADAPKIPGDDDALTLLRALSHQYFLEKGASMLPVLPISLPSPDSGNSKTPHHEASQILYRILRGPYEYLLDEYLDLLTVTEHHIPPFALPDLLDKAVTDPDFAQKIRPLAGSRGRWLSEQVPRWAVLFAEIDPGRWPVAGFHERIQILRQIRKKNPSEAIALLQSTWPTEGWQERQAFLKTLEKGLSPADEPFLEDCLKDKRKEVRKEAAHLLAQIPQSVLSGRLQNFARSWIQPGGLLSPPNELSAEVLKIGLEHAGHSKASWIRYIVGHIDPNYWASEFSTSPSEWMKHLQGTDWYEPAMEGLAQSISLFSRHLWADELLDAMTGSSEATVKLVSAPWGKLVSAKAIHLATVETLESSWKILPEKSTAYKILLCPGQELDERTVLDVWEGFKWRVFRSSANDWSLFHYRVLFRNLALRAPRHLSETLQEDFESSQGEWKSWEGDIRQFLETLAFRQAMYRTFQP